MPETDVILSAIRDSNLAMIQAVKESAAGTEKALDRLAKAIEHIPAIQDRLPKETNGSPGWQALVLMIAVLAAVMSPALVMVSAQQASIVEIKGHVNAENDRGRVVATDLGQVREKFAKIETQFNGSALASKLESDRTGARFDKLEEWQKWWYRTMPFSVALQEAKIDVIENQINNRTEDRFFGREGAALGQRIGDIEKALRNLPPLQQGP